MQSSLYYNNSITPNYGPYNLTKQTEQSNAYDYLSWKRSTIQKKQAQQNSNKIQPKKSNRPVMKNSDESIDSEQPFYSTWLFWVLLLILIAIAVGIGFGAFKLQEYIKHQMKKNHMITSFSPVPNAGDFLVNAGVQPYATSSSNIQSGYKLSLTRVFSDTDKIGDTSSQQQSQLSKDIQPKNKDTLKQTQENTSESNSTVNAQNGSGPKNVQNQTQNKTQSSQNKTALTNTTKPQLSAAVISPKNTAPIVLPQVNTLPSPQTYPSLLPLSNPTYPSRYA